MTIARIGDKVYDPTMIRCGCGANALLCEVAMERGDFCCHCCDHVHDLATLARYGLLER